MKTIKKQNQNLEFQKYLLLQKQFNILNSELSEEYSIEDLFNELDWILCENSSAEQKEVLTLFERLKELISESQTNIIIESKKFLNSKK